MTCDPYDDVVDNFSSLHVGVASKLAQHTYTESKWQQFYASLCLIYEIEDLWY